MFCVIYLWRSFSPFFCSMKYSIFWTRWYKCCRFRVFWCYMNDKMMKCVIFWTGYFFFYYFGVVWTSPMPKMMMKSHSRLHWLARSSLLCVNMQPPFSPFSSAAVFRQHSRPRLLIRLLPAGIETTVPQKAIWHRTIEAGDDRTNWRTVEDNGS